MGLSLPRVRPLQVSREEALRVSAPTSCPLWLSGPQCPAGPAPALCQDTSLHTPTIRPNGGGFRQAGSSGGGVRAGGTRLAGNAPLTQGPLTTVWHGLQTAWGEEMGVLLWGRVTFGGEISSLAQGRVIHSQRWKPCIQETPPRGVQELGGSRVEPAVLGSGLKAAPGTLAVTWWLRVGPGGPLLAVR